MSTNSFSRLGSANSYDNAVNNLNKRQAGLSALQENLTSGKKIVRPSDDPTGAAQAERSLMRISRIQSDQRALEMQRNSISSAETALGDVTSALQSFRDLVVSAGNAGMTSADRQTIAQQLTGLRDQVFAMSNTKDTNGLPLFGALASALAPFVRPGTPPPDYSFNGVAGQSSSTEVSIPTALDGDKAFMFKPAQDGSFNVTYATNLGGSSTGPVTLQNPAAVTGSDYQMQFSPDPASAVPGAMQYTVTQMSAPPVVGVATPYISGQPIVFDGLSLTVTGTPQSGDTMDIKANSSIFGVMDRAISGIGSAPSSAVSQQAVGQALANLDIGLNRVTAARGLAGDLLNRADRITTNQESRTVQLEADKGRAEDLDMIKGISDFQNQQTGYSAALQSYAQIQKLSLFNYIG